jgi:hypothetical protein
VFGSLQLRSTSSGFGNTKLPTGTAAAVIETTDPTDTIIQFESLGSLSQGIAAGSGGTTSPFQHWRAICAGGAGVAEGKGIGEASDEAGMGVGVGVAVAVEVGVGDCAQTLLEAIRQNMIIAKYFIDPLPRYCRFQPSFPHSREVSM